MMIVDKKTNILSKIHSLSIRTYIMTLIVIMTMLPLGLIVNSSLQQRNQDIQAAKYLAEHLVENVCYEQNMLLSGAEQLLSTLSQIPAMQKHDVKGVNTLLAGIIKKNPQYSNLAIHDSTGLQWAAALPVKGPVDVADRRYFRNLMATGQFSSGEYVIGRAHFIPVIHFAYPIKNTSGKISDVAIAVIALDWFNQYTKSKTFPANTSLLLTDHKGSILYNVTVPEFIGKQDREDLFRRMSEGPDKGTFEAVSNNGTNRYYAYQKLRLSGEQTPYMYLRAGIAVEPILGKTHSKLLFDVGFMLSLLLLEMAFAYYISKVEIVNKIEYLRVAMGKVAQGNLDIHVSNYVNGAELEELGKSFDTMAERLADDISKRKSVEQSLIEKTQLLADINNNLEQKINQAVSELRQKDHLLIQQSRLGVMGEMIHNIAHQWRQPLNNIGLIIQNLQYALKSGDINENLVDDEINKAMQILLYMSRTIDDFRNFFKKDEEKQLFPIAKTVEQTISLIADALKREYINIVLKLDDEITTFGYKNEYTQALLNIINNAKDVLLERKIENPLITIKVFRENDLVVVTVHDNGGGIDESILTSIFDPYFTTKGPDKGTGIGLYMSKIIIEKNMGGSLTVATMQGGAEFRIELQAD